MGVGGGGGGEMRAGRCQSTKIYPCHPVERFFRGKNFDDDSGLFAIGSVL